MDTQPKIPTLKDSQKPQVKIRGLEAGVTLFDRLKQFKKKDLAFILAGLGTLFMAPLAEHFMMSPESGDGTLQAGLRGGGKGIFDGSGSSPYEPGTSGLAPGSAIGGGSDIITPLNVRDPSALVMGPGATQQPPTNSVMPPTAPPTAPGGHTDSDLKDALAASARGAGAAAKKALLPVPKVALGGSGLRGLGVASGGSSASGGGGGPISSNGLVSGKAATGGGLGGVKPTSGYKGVARGQASGDTGGLDALKKAADAAAGAFNRGGASSGLNEAANTAIPAGGGSFGGNGQGGGGSTDKPNGGDQNKDGKSVGESLAFLKAKAIQEAQIALWAKEQEAGDNKLEALKIRNSMAEAVAGTFGSALGNLASCPFTPGVGTGDFQTCFSQGGVTSYSCYDKDHEAVQIIPASQVSSSPVGCNDQQSNGKTTSGKQYYIVSGNLAVCPNKAGISGLTACKANDGSSPSGDPAGGPKSGVDGFAGANKDELAALNGMKGVCDAITKDLNKTEPPYGSASQKWLKSLQNEAQGVVAVRDALTKGPSTGDCGSSPLSLNASVISLEKTAMGSMTGAQGASAGTGVFPLSKTAATAVDPKAIPSTADMSRNVSTLRDALKQVTGKYCPDGTSCLNTNILYTSDVIPTNKDTIEIGGKNQGELDTAKSYLTMVKSAHGAVDKMLNNVVTVQTGIQAAAGDSVDIAGGTPPGGSGSADGTLKPLIDVNKTYQTLKSQADDLKITATPPTDAAPSYNPNVQGTKDATTAAKTALNGGTDSKGASTHDGLSDALTKYQALTTSNPPSPQPAVDAAKKAAETALGKADQSVATMQSTQTTWIDQSSSRLTQLAPQVDDAATQAAAAK